MRIPKTKETFGAVSAGKHAATRLSDDAERKNDMEHENKRATTAWLTPSVIEHMDRWLERDNCQSRSEFIAKALNFYLGYLESRDASAYLPEVLSATLKGILENNNNRLRSLLFKWAVELNMLCHTMAYHYRVDEIDRRALREFAVEEVKRSCGQVSFDHALDVQRQAPVEDEDFLEDDDWGD